MYPGEGAIEYARGQVAGLTREEATKVIRQIMAGNPDDLRVKRCVCCGYPFRDRTRPNNAKVCGESCKSIVKTRQKRAQRGLKEKSKKPSLYLWWLDYPFWIQEWAMFNHVGSYERPYDPEKLEYKASVRRRIDSLGGRRRENRSALS